MSPVFGTIAALAGVVAVSYLVEALRRAPQAPDILPWAPDIPIRHVSVSGSGSATSRWGAALRWCCCIPCGPSSTSSSE